MTQRGLLSLQRLCLFKFFPHRFLRENLLISLLYPVPLFVVGELRFAFALDSQ